MVVVVSPLLLLAAWFGLSAPVALAVGAVLHDGSARQQPVPVAVRARPRRTG